MGPDSPGDPGDPDGPWRHKKFLTRSKGKIAFQKTKTKQKNTSTRIV